jgi:hypothetical protein
MNYLLQHRQSKVAPDTYTLNTEDGLADHVLYKAGCPIFMNPPFNQEKQMKN